MKPGIPWSVKGVEPEAREAAKIAARRSGLTLGEWLNNVIFDQSEHNLEQLPLTDSHAWENYVSAAPPPSDPPRPEPSRSARRDDNAMRLQDIAQQLASLAQRERQSAPSPVLDRTPSAEREEFERIVERINDNERQTVEALTAVNERLNRLGQQIAQIGRQPAGFERPEDVPGYSALETAIRNVVEHIEVSERRTRDSLKAMQERLGEISERSHYVPTTEDFLRAAPVLSNLEARLSDMLGRIQRSEGLVNERLEGVKSAAQQMANQAQSSAVTAARGELREMETRLLASLREAQQAATGPGSVTSEISRLHGDVAGLAKRVEDIRAGSASERDVHALRVALEQLSTRVAQGPDMRPLADMDKRLGDISWRLEQASANPSGPQVSALEQRIAELDHRLAEAMRLQGSQQATERLEESIAAVSARVAQTEDQLLHLETIEQAIRQLYESFDQTRQATSQAAEEAANRALERYRPAPTPIGPSPELRALEEGLRAVRESAAGAERRQQETFEAVHETLAEIVEKLAQLETQPVRQPAPQAYAPPPPPPVQPAAAAAAPKPLEEIFAAPPPRRFEPEPEPQPEPQPAPRPALSAGDDFIAAARRAAQAASAKPASIAEPVQDGERKGFSLPFTNRFRKKPAAAAEAAPPEPQPPPAAAKAPRFSGMGRKALICAGIAVLLAASYFAYRNLTAADSAPKAQSRIEAPATRQQASAQPGLVLGPSDPIVTASLPQGSLAKVLQEPEAPVAGQLPPEVGAAALRQAATAGDARAQFIIAGRYLEGQGVARDFGTAFYWYQQAASQGLAPAQYRVGTLYDLGRGVPKDAAKALIWYERAAQGGNIRAMYNTAVLAAGDQAGPTDYAKAFRWFDAAASRGFRDSQFNLAILYEKGLGVAPDLKEAYFWYSLAGQRGDTDSAARADILARSLTPQERTAAEERLASWQPAPSDDTANAVTVLEPGWTDSFLSGARRQIFS